MIVRVPLKLPSAGGLKVTCKARLSEGSNVVGPVHPTNAKDPVMVTSSTVMLVAPPLLRVTVLLVLVVPTV